MQLYVTPPDFDHDAFMTALGERFSLKTEDDISRAQCFYDSFDWRLYKENLTLVQTGKTFTLRSLEDDTTISSIRLDHPLVFEWDLPDSGLRDKLKPIIEMRALLALFEITSNSRIIRILDDEEKTVARLKITDSLQGNDNRSAMTKHISLLPVRGYEKNSRELADFLIEHQFYLTDESIYTRALHSFGKTPGDYSAKPNLNFTPDMRSDEAAKEIYRFLASIMRRNEAGVKEDIDTEYLHDFRVSVRRTRSALSQLKGVFPEDVANRYKDDFRYIGRLTNELRDLDVYLLSADDYRMMLPDYLQADIRPLFAFLSKNRVSALMSVIKGLNSEQYSRIMNDWEAYIQEPPEDTPDAANAALPVIDLAKSRIYKRYRSILKEGNAITDSSPDDALHNLRINCKKLRYLLEFFSSLFPKKEIGVIVKQLKRLQDNLGSFQDLCVQSDTLMAYSSDPFFSGPENHKALLAIGCLIGKLDVEKLAVRNAFAKTFEAFSSRDNQVRFKNLFNH